MDDNAILFIDDHENVAVDLSNPTNTTLWDVSIVDGNNIGQAGTLTAGELNAELGINSFTGDGILTTLIPEPGKPRPAGADGVLMLMRRRPRSA